MTVQTPPRRDLPAKGLANFISGEAGERFVAHTVLALMACHLRMAEMVDLHIAGALGTLEEQPHRLQTVRVERDITIVRVLTQAGDMSATLLLPMIGDMVIAPLADFETILLALRAHRGCTTPVTLSDIVIDHVRVRLRTARSRTALHEIMEIGSLETRADRITNVLQQCLLPSLKPVAPLDMADAFLSLARKFASLENNAISRFSLQKAEFHMRLYSDSTDDEAHLAMSDVLMRKIGRLADCLSTAAS